MSSGNTLYNKYRPLKFRDVIGQSRVIASLKGMLKKGIVPHAILFSGIQGVGKTTLARILARYLNCQHPTDDFEPCNECPSCLASLQGINQDLIEVDAASQRGIDDIRNIQELSNLMSQQNCRVFIIDEVHDLTTQAVDAILKTLEEPPNNLYFMFCTTTVNKIKPTFLSRCSRFKLWRVEERTLMKYLATVCSKEKVEVVEERALLDIARVSKGSVRDALSILETVMNSGVTSENVYSLTDSINPVFVLDLIQYLVSRDYRKYVGAVESLIMEGGSPVALFSDLVRHFYNLAKAKAGYKKLKEQVPRFQFERYLSLVSEMSFSPVDALASLWKLKPVYSDDDFIMACVVLFSEIHSIKTSKVSTNSISDSDTKEEKKEPIKDTKSSEVRKYAYWVSKLLKAEVKVDSLQACTLEVKGMDGSLFLIDIVEDIEEIRNSYYFLLDDIKNFHFQKGGETDYLKGLTINDLVQDGFIKRKER
ncbi:MAG: DNA polymerase III subunit gamma/tau [Candidatus Heimdallarchaeaceae archaeon]